MRARTGVETLERRTLMSAGGLDTAFGTGGVVTTDFGSRDDGGRAIAVDAQGRIVTAGDSSGADSAFALTRHTFDGAVDATFAGGSVRTPFTIAFSVEASAVAIDGDGRIVVAGRVFALIDGTFESAIALARYNENGTLDGTFDSGDDDGDGTALLFNSTLSVGHVDDISLVIDDGGGIHVGFTAVQSESSSDIAVTHLGPNGGTPHTIVTNLSTVDLSGGLAVDKADRVVQAGTYGSGEPGSVRKLLTTRYTTTGGLDASYGESGVNASTTTPMDFVRSVFLDAEDRLVLAGTVPDTTTTGKSQLILARVDDDGSNDVYTTTGVLATRDHWSLGVQRDGKLVAAGTDYNGLLGYVLARFTIDPERGTFQQDLTFGNGGGVYASTSESVALGVMTDAEGILVAGQAGPDFLLARHHSDITPGGTGVTANANVDTAPYTVVEGGLLPLKGFGTSPPGGGSSFTLVQSERRVEVVPGSGTGGGSGSVTYAWDFDGIGDFDDATGATPNFPALGFDGDEDGTPHTIRLKVTDAVNQSLSCVSTAVVTVINTAPTASIAAPAGGVEGQTVSLTANVTDPGDTFGFLYEWVLSGGAVIDQSAANGPTFTFTPADNGTYRVTLKVTDKDNAHHDAQPVDLVVDNATPTATINGGNVTVNEGAAVALTATTADVAADTLSYLWSVKRNGVAYATGQSAGFTLAMEDDGAYEVSLTVTDKDGGIGVAIPVPVTAKNVAPTPQASSDLLGLRGEERTLTLNAVEPGVADLAAGLTYTVDWGDGSAIETVVLTQPGELRHVYQQVGTFEVKVTAADKDRLPTDPPLVPQIVTMTSQGSELENGVLNVSGSTGNDILRLFRSDGQVAVGNLTSGGLEFVQTYTGTIDRVIVVGQAGNDHIDASAFNVPVEIFGGAGNDRLIGGSAADVLVGGAGDDRIAGNGGRDLLIGGGGRDRIFGDAEEDILVGGYTAHDADLGSLRLISDEWRGGNSYDDRVLHLQGVSTTNSRVNGSAILLADVTTWDDGDTDVLSGNAGRDWFFFNADRETNRDRVVDAASLEELEEVDLEEV